MDYGGGNFRVLSPLLEIASKLTPEEYQAQIVPSLAKWFTSQDYSLRVNLLKNISSFSDHLTPELVNAQVPILFPFFLFFILFFVFIFKIFIFYFFYFLFFYFFIFFLFLFLFFLKFLFIYIFYFEKIYPSVERCFRDENPNLREVAVRCVLYLVPKLDKNTLKTNLLNYFSKLQTDPKPGISLLFFFFFFFPF